jgi:hypothetical protein
MPIITTDRMIDVIGKVPKPQVIWQQQFDGHNETLKELAKSEWHQVPESHLWAYINDLTYQELQPDLFRHLFPTCLKFWYDTLMCDRQAARGEADFHLLHGNILSKMLNEAERQRLYKFFADGFLDRVDQERGFRYEPPGESANAWIGRFNSIGLVAPIISTIWTDWWSMDSPGKAVCAMMYATGLIYSSDDNPVYPRWTSAEGGGGPYLSQWDASELDHVWLDPNVSFLRSILSPAYIIEKMDAAATALRDEPEADVATRIANDARSRGEDIEIRIDALITNLTRPELEKEIWNR